MENHRLGQSTSPTEIHGSLNILYFCHCRHFCEPFDGNHVYSFHIFFLRDGNLVAVPHYHWMDDGCTVNNDCGDFTYHLLFLGLVLCHSLHLDWNSFCWLEALSVMCSVRQTIIAFFFIIVAWCSTAKTWQTEQKKEKTEEETISPFTSSTHRETHTHAILLLLCPHFLWSCQQAPQWLSQLAVNIRATLSPKTFRCTPPNPSVQTSGAGQSTMSPRSRGTVGPTQLPVWLFGLLLSIIISHIHTPHPLFY